VATEVAGNIGAGHLTGGFYADLVVRYGDGPFIAVEVDGPRRFYHGCRERTAVCELKDAELHRCFDQVVHIGFWEWPRVEAKQGDFLKERLTL